MKFVLYFILLNSWKLKIATEAFDKHTIYFPCNENNLILKINNEVVTVSCEKETPILDKAQYPGQPLFWSYASLKIGSKSWNEWVLHEHITVTS